MNIRPFELVLIGFFALAAVLGLTFFALYKDKPSEEQLRFGQRVEVWGTLSERVFTDYFAELVKSDKAFERVKYTHVDKERFKDTLINAIADGRSPDLIVIPHSDLVTYRTKIRPFTEKEISVRTFKDTYIDGADIFTLSDGVYGVPFAVDPMVMYWNRDIFSNSGLAQPPTTWEQLINGTIQSIVKKDAKGNITTRAVALGEYQNITNAKDIVATLLLQSGTPIIDEGVEGYSVVLDTPVPNGLSTGDAAFGFYAQFVNPAKDIYTWNRGEENDRKQFVGGTLALYFGKGSERQSIDRENANLNFDVAPFPQGAGVTTKRVYGDFYAFSVLRGSQNPEGAYALAQALTSGQAGATLVDALGFVPAQRALYGVSDDPWKSVILKSALVARGWLDPNERGSAVIFKDTIEGVSSGRVRMKDAMIDAVYALETLF